MEVKQDVYTFSAEAENVPPLLCRAQAGDEAAFEALLKQYAPLLAAAVKDCVGEDASGEAYTEACEAMHEAVLHWKPGRNTTFGLYARICVRRALRRYCAFLECGAKDELPDEEVASESMEAAVLNKETVGLILHRLKQILSETEYLVFLDYANGFSIRETAKRRSLSDKAVSNARARAMAKIQKAKAHFAEY